MTALLGLDLGTSAVKAVVVDEEGRVLGTGTREIPMEVPEPQRAEQDPAQWWSNAVMAVRAATHAARVHDVAAIGLDGHMHGVLLLDAAHRPVGRAITWADQRSAALIPEMEAAIGVGTFLEVTGTRPAAGFMGPTLAWLGRHEPARLDTAAVSILPKDYLRLRLVGSVASDVSDASATALFDIAARRWSSRIMAELGLPERILPPLLESAEVAGQLREDAAAELGLRAGIPVVAGSADQPAQAVANGLLQRGQGSVTVGTGGQILCATDAPLADERGRIHTFCHAAPGRWYQLGATLSAGLSLRWLRDRLRLSSENPYASLDRLAAEIPPGADGLTFLPYLVGERSPIMDPSATGAFVGLTLSHRRAHLARAVLEGVACSLRATRDAVVDAGGGVDERWLATGNGLASPLWRSILADVLGEPLGYVDAPERTGVGAALLGGIGAGVYAGYAEAAAEARPPLLMTDPEPSRVAAYDEVHARYLALSALLLEAGRRLASPGPAAPVAGELGAAQPVPATGRAPALEGPGG
jgi:xylulokinase